MPEATHEPTADGLLLVSGSGTRQGVRVRCMLSVDAGPSSKPATRRLSREGGVAIQPHTSLAPHVATARAEATGAPVVPLGDGPVLLSALVVEDDAFGQHILSAQLEEANRLDVGTAMIVPTFVSNLHEAMGAIAHSPRFDLMLLDIELPYGNGDTALPQLRSKLGDRAVMFAMSGHQMQTLVQRCILLGADDFLVKPFKVDALRRMWRIWLGKNRDIISGNLPASPLNNDGPNGLHLTKAVDDALEAMALASLNG